LAPILSIAPRLSTARRLSLVWGVHSTVSADIESIDEMVSAARWIAIREGMVREGDQVTIAAGMPFGEAGTTNLLRITEI
jgi:pyruvate kinase